MLYVFCVACCFFVCCFVVLKLFLLYTFPLACFLCICIRCFLVLFENVGRVFFDANNLLEMIFFVERQKKCKKSFRYNRLVFNALCFWCKKRLKKKCQKLAYMNIITLSLPS